MHVHEFYLMHPNTVYLNDNLTPLKPVRQSMVCIKYSNIMCAERKAQNTPFIHTCTSLKILLLEAINRQV